MWGTTFAPERQFYLPVYVRFPLLHCYICNWLLFEITDLSQLLIQCFIKTEAVPWGRSFLRKEGWAPYPGGGQERFGRQDELLVGFLSGSASVRLVSS